MDRGSIIGVRSSINALICLLTATYLAISGFFTTEETIRRALGDTLPRDWIDFAVDQSGRTRQELLDRVSTEVGKSKVYLKDDRAKDAYLEENPKHSNDFARLKGLGEMDAGELWDTTMDPARRTLLQVSVEQAAIADEIFSILMGEDVESRKNFIQSNAKDVRFLDI